MPIDEGNYKCVFRRTHDGQEVSQTFLITFITPVMINTEDNLVYKNLSGESTRLLCDSHNHNQLQWQDITTTPISSNERVEIIGTDLVFHKLLLTDNGKYLCVASNQLGYKMIHAQLAVHGESVSWWSCVYYYCCSIYWDRTKAHDGNPLINILEEVSQCKCSGRVWPPQ